MRTQPVCVVALAAVLGCGNPTSSEPTSPPAPASDESPDEGPPSLSVAERVAHVDARRGSALAAVVRRGPATTRRAALWALGRVHDDASAEALLVGLRDADPEARRAAAFGVGALEREASSSAVQALIGALAAEPRAAVPTDEGAPEVVRSTRAMMLWSLARTTDERGVPALESALGDDTESRLAVCRGLAYAGPTGWPESLLRAAISRAAEDASPRVREACWQGLGRVTLPSSLLEDARTHAAAALADTARDADAVEIRVQAARVLGRLPPTDATWEALRVASLDAEWRVAVTAMRALGLQSSGRESMLGAALEAALDRWWPPPPMGTVDPGPASGGSTHVVLTLLEAAQGYARAAPIHDRASLWLARIERVPPSRDQAWVECRAAQLVDLGRGWPSRVDRCGVGLLDDDTRRALAAEVIGRQEGAEAQRVTYLERLVRDGGPRTHEAVLVAVASLPPELALPFARAGLESEDEGVILTALELVKTLAPTARQRRDDAALAASLRGEARPPARFFTELDAPLRAATARLLASDSLEGRVTLASVASVLADPGAQPDQHALIEQLSPLASHPSHGVRVEARAALTALGAEVPVTVDPVPDSLTLASDLPRRATLRTERGEIVIELFSEVSPTTTQRFTQLAREDFFDGLTFHRVVPGFVAQGGDPRGDGYGGPSWWQRCEDSPLAYERGTVGMALAGRDTGGSQFFITTGPQHHLDGRYTVFGRVVQGLEHVDALQVGDRIHDVTLDPAD